MIEIDTCSGGQELDCLKWSYTTKTDQSAGKTEAIPGIQPNAMIILQKKTRLLKKSF
jgi:hypothetical protein